MNEELEAIDMKPSRNPGERIGSLEQDMKVVNFRLHQWDRRHENHPERLARLEQQFANQSDKLDDLEAGISEINKTVQRMGTKITYGVGFAVAVMIALDKAWPFIIKGLAP